MTEFYFAIGLALVILLITFLLSRRFKKVVNVVVLTGVSDSGKTALFSKIVFNKPRKSVTSLKENEATLEELNIKLVDLPGSDRLRNLYYESYRDQAKHVVFVLDSTTLKAKLREVSEHLYMILSDTKVYKNKVRLTIACNKQDVEDALDPGSIRSILEKELCAIRNTKAGQLAKTSNEESEDYLDRFKTRDITFENLGVKLVETSINSVDQLIKNIF